MIAGLRGAAFAALLAGAASCSSPSEPDAVNIGGAWTGTWSFVTAGVTVTDTANVSFTQSGSSASGTWTSASGPGGQLGVDLSAVVSGTASISVTLQTGTICSATTTLTGTATSTRVQLTLGSVPVAGLCQWATNNEFVFTR